MKRCISLIAAAIACAATGLTVPRLGLAAEEFQEVIVEGQYLSSSEVNSIKTPTPILDVPQSLSIVTSEQITEQGFTSIGDIIDYTPGVNTSQGEGHRDAVVFRGVRSTADFYIDGVRDDVQYYRPLYNLEQVEILRGPNALLFGRGGTGGILNRVTKKGELGQNFTGYQIGVDTFGAFSLQADNNTSINDDVAVRFNAFYESLDNHRDFYDGDRIGINPTMRVAFGSDTTLDVSYEYIDHQRFIDRGIPTGADGRPVKAFEDIVFGDPDLNETTLEAHIFRAVVQHQFSDGLKGNFTAHYGDYDKFYQNFYASAYDQANTPNIVELDGYVDTTDRTNLVLSASLVSEFDTGSLGHTLIIGAESIDTSSDQDRFNAVWSTSGNDKENFVISSRILSGGSGLSIDSMSNTMIANNSFSQLNDDTRVDVEVNSFFIQDEVAIFDQLDIVLGARFDSFEIDVDTVDADEFNNNDNIVITSRNRKDEEVSPRFGLIYKPIENISVYASYSESFLPRSGEQFASINDETEALNPDVFKNTEVGVKWDIGKSLSLTAAIFENEQSSPQTADSDPATLDVLDSKIEGFELQLLGNLTEQWFLSAGYSYLSGRQVDDFGNKTLRPAELPRNTLAVWNMYQATDNFGLGLGVTYQDDSFVNSSNSATLPSYTRVDAAAYYDISDSIRLQLNIENLTDELYFPNAHSTHQVTVGAPLNARFTISGKI